MTRPIPHIALDFLKRAEACKLHAYQDSVGVWTIGIGHTGSEVHRGLVIDQAQADAYLFSDATIAARRLAARVDEERLLALSDHQYAALLSFVFNLGADDWTIWKVINAGKLEQVPAQLMRFVNADGHRLPGLVNRRTAEVALWNTPDVQAAVAVVQAAPVPPPPSSETRAAETAPTPVPPKPMAATSLTAKVVGLTAAAGAGAKQVVDIVQPHADLAPIFHNVVIGLTAVIIVSAAVGLWVSSQQNKARHQ